MIASFRDRETRAIFEGTSSKKARRKLPTQLWKKARAKLDVIDVATDLGQLASPSNKLHSLSGDREGQHAIWINDQYRICFVWIDEESEARNVEITDYH